MFIENKYTRIYRKLIWRGSDRLLLGGTPTPDTYYERHHIVPRCMGGTDDLSNLALLTAREHYLAHWLLVKMVAGQVKYKMQFAFFRMSTENAKQQRNISARQYEVARKHHAEACRTIGGHKRGKKWNGSPEGIASKVNFMKKNNPMNDPILRKKAATNKAKTYIITHPDGNVETVTNMAQYCRERNLHPGNMSSVAKGSLKHYKGMVVRYA